MRHVCLYYGKRSAGTDSARSSAGVDRQGAFFSEASAQGLDKLVEIRTGAPAAREQIERFHTREYVETVMYAERDGLEYLDTGTPASRSLRRRGGGDRAALDGLTQVMRGHCHRTFQPIGGLHHARRDGAAGFCVFNDLGVVIETLRSEHHIRRVAYIDIDVHHGDGVFYAYEDDPDLIFADIHEDGRHLYPGTGHASETGKVSQGHQAQHPAGAGAGRPGVSRSLAARRRASAQVRTAVRGVSVRRGRFGWRPARPSHLHAASACACGPQPGRTSPTSIAPDA